MSRTENFNISILDPMNVDSFAHENYFLDTGVDSVVFRLGKHVLKRYTKLPLEKLELYRDITDIAAKLAPQYSRSIGGYGQTTLRVEPIERIIQSSKTGLVYGLSRYVGGERGKEKVHEQWHELLESFTTAVRLATGYNGIEISPSNSKMNKTGIFNVRSVCTITDLCVAISNLHRGSW